MKTLSTANDSNKKYGLLLLTFMLLSFTALNAQSITWSFVNAAGFVDGPDGSLRWTMGEALTTEVSGSDATLRMGFMPFAFVEEMSSASRSLDPDIEITITPNPASNEITLRVPGNDDNLVRIMSLDGRHALAENVRSETRIEIRDLPPGTYVLYVIRPSGSFNTQTFIKI